jgi:hypothetical protein
VSLEELEAIRKKVLLYSRGLLLLGVVLILLALRGGWWSLLLLIGIFLIALSQLQVHVLRVGLKVALVAPLAEALGFRYSFDQGFSREDILASGLFPPPDKHDSEDLVEGEVKGIPFASSDIALYNKVEDSYQKFFGGTLYRFRLPFSIEGEVRFGPRGRGMVVKDRWILPTGIFMIAIAFLMLTVGVLFGGLSVWDALPFYVFLVFFFLLFLVSALPRRKGLGLERVVLESREFERLYDVYGDQVGARKLLTPRVQEALVRLRNYFGKPVWGAVRGRYLWLAVEERDRFSVPVNRPVSEVFEMEKRRYQEELLEASRVVEALRLEEEARRRGAWRRKLFVDLNEFSSASRKSATFDGDRPQQPEDATTRRSIFFRR